MPFLLITSVDRESSLSSVFRIKTISPSVCPVKDEENHSLQGAQFELRKIVNDQDEGTKIDTDTVTEGTKFNFKGLDAGKYKLIETVTPSGYNTIQPIIFTIEATYDEE